MADKEDRWGRSLKIEYVDNHNGNRYIGIYGVFMIDCFDIVINIALETNVYTHIFKPRYQ